MSQAAQNVPLLAVMGRGKGAYGGTYEGQRTALDGGPHFLPCLGQSVVAQQYISLAI